MWNVDESDSLQALRLVPPEVVVDPGTSDEGDGKDLKSGERQPLSQATETSDDEPTRLCTR